MEKPKNLILNKIIPAILALGSIANLALLVASFLSKYNPGGLSAHSVTFLISSSPIVNSLFVILVMSWILFAIRNREMFKRDFNVLFGIILFVSYVTAYILFDTSYYIRDSAVDMSYKLEDLRPYLKSDQSKDDKEKNLQLAIADLKEIKDDIGKKTPAVVYYLLGKAYFEQKNFSESLKLYKEALDIKNLSRDKNTKDYEFNYATTSLYMCSPDSISLFEGYVEKYPNDITGLMSLAISYHVAYVLSNKLQDAEKAEEQYDRTISKIKERTSIEGAFIKDYYTK